MNPTTRLSDTEYLILTLLEERPMYGLEMIEQSGGNLKKGTVYVLLGRLEDKDLVHGEYQIDGGAVPRRFYTMTAHGLDVFRLWKKLHELAA